MPLQTFNGLHFTERGALDIDECFDRRMPSTRKARLVPLVTTGVVFLLAATGHGHIFVSRRIASMSVNHHPDADKSYDTDGGEPKVSSREYGGPAKKHDGERQSAADDHHPHHRMILFFVVIVHIFIFDAL